MTDAQTPNDSVVHVTESFCLVEAQGAMKNLGTACWLRNTLGRTVKSVSFFCWKCGRVWAKRNQNGADWRAYSRKCAPCGGHGSLIDGWWAFPESDLPVDTMPRELMRYELSIFNEGPEP